MVKETKKQTMRFNDVELSLIKSTFSENDALLKAIRKVFLQIVPSKEDSKLLDQAFKGNKELFNLLSKTFNPKIDGDAPLHQLLDLWMTVEIKDKSPEEVMAICSARKMLIDILEEKLDVINDIVESKESKKPLEIDVSKLSNIENKDGIDVYVNLIARNTLINHVEAMLMQLLVLAGQKDDTVEKTLEKLAKNSAK